MEFVEELLNVCRCRDDSRVIKILQKGVSVNAQNAEGETPLQIASANGCTEIANFLLNQGAFVDLSNNYGWTPLMHATLHGHSDVVTLLLNRKAKVNTCNKSGLAAVDFAAWNGDLPILKLLVEAGAVVDRTHTSRSNEWDFSSLMMAAIQGHCEVFQFLLERGSAINYTSPITGLTPLMLAVCNGHQQLVKIVIELGANINKINIRGKSAIDMAVECGHNEIVAYLDNVSFRNSGSAASNEDILQAIRNGDVLKVKSIIQQNPETINSCDGFDGTTPLMLAAIFGHNDIIEALINNGVDLNAQDMNNGWTALMYAVFHRNAETVKALVESGARVDVFAYTGYTALDLATYIGSSDSDIFHILNVNCEVGSSNQRLRYSSCFDKSDQGFLSPEENQTSVSPEKSPSQSQSKEYCGILSQTSQLKTLIYSSKFLAASPIGTNAESNDESEEVFSELNSSYEGPEKFTLSSSKFLPPHKYFATILQDHKVGTIRPNFLSCHMDDVNAIPSRKASSEKINKPPLNSLKTPHLVKLLVERKRMQFDTTNVLHLDDSLLEFSDSTSKPEDLAFKPGGSLLKPNDLTLQFDDSASKTGHSMLKTDDSMLKFDDLTLKLNDLTLQLDDIPKSNVSNMKSAEVALKASCSISNSHQSSHSGSLGADSNLCLSEKELEEKVQVPEIERSGEAAESGDLTVLLNKESLQKYVQKFQDQEIDLEAFLCLTEDDFEKIGIETHNSRQKFLDIISKMRNT